MDTLNSKTEVAEGSAPCSLQSSHPEPVARHSDQTAMHVVLITPNLLSNIISQMPLADIVTTTGVSQFWRNAIAADPQVQKALFLKSAEGRRVLVHNTLLDSNSEKRFSQYSPGDAIPKEFCSTIGHMHPFLHKICGMVNGGYNKVEDEDFALDFGHSKGCWRDMFISQPPCESIKFLLIAEWGLAVQEIKLRYTDKKVSALENSRIASCLS
jgi:hypothetical protein